MRIILATRNPSKLAQVRQSFLGSCLKIDSMDDAQIEGQGREDLSPEALLKANARSKARYVHERVRQRWVMADDTGLYIEALDGLPGVQAATWAGVNAATDEITKHTLKKLNGCSNRAAYFETVVLLISPDGGEYCFPGKMSGTLMPMPRCRPHPGMPYSPIFMPQGTDKVYAEMTLEEEDRFSARGIACKKARQFLEDVSRPGQ